MPPMAMERRCPRYLWREIDESGEKTIDEGGRFFRESQSAVNVTFGEIQYEQGTHAIIAETFPHFGGEKKV